MGPVAQRLLRLGRVVCVSHGAAADCVSVRCNANAASSRDRNARAAGCRRKTSCFNAPKRIKLPLEVRASLFLASAFARQRRVRRRQRDLAGRRTVDWSVGARRHIQVNTLADRCCSHVVGVEMIRCWEMLKKGKHLIVRSNVLRWKSIDSPSKMNESLLLLLLLSQKLHFILLSLRRNCTSKRL